MFRLRRLYFDSIGVTENRFADLLVDLTDSAGEPADAIVWLRNGAGKTTMLSLLLALILPDRRDFLATRTKKRTLEDLVLAGDTAHVVAEWTDPDGQLLLTGAVYEWDGRTRPHDYNGRGKERLQRNWWCVHPDPAVAGATLDDLPFTLRSGGNYDRDRFCTHVRGLAALGVNAVVASQSIAEWHGALRERRFDPDLFRYFTEVNAAEGGIDGLFNDIDSPGRFVRYLLRFVGDHQRVAPVRELLSDTAVEIAKRPAYAAQRQFCVDAAPRVTALGDAHRRFVVRRDERAAIVGRSAALKRALFDAVAAATARYELAEQRAADYDAQISEVRAQIDLARRRRDEYAFRAAKFELTEAKKLVEQAKIRMDQCKLEADAWAAAERYAQLEERKVAYDAHRSALETAARDARPLIDRCDTAKAVLAAALTGEIEKIGLVIEELAVRRDQAEADGDAAAERWRQAERRLAELDSEAERIRGQLARFEDDCRSMVADGIIGASERLGDAVNRLAEEHVEAAAELERLRSERDDLQYRIGTAATIETKAQEKTGGARTAYQELDGQLNRLVAKARRLADDSRLRTLHQTDLVELETVATETITLLTREITAAEKMLAALGEESARGERAIRALADIQLLPPRLAVEKVIEKLDDAGITAVAGWHYLAKHIDRTDHGRYITELPEVLDGVIVYGDATAVAAAADRAGSSDELVVISAAGVFEDRRAAHVVIGPAEAQHDTAAGSTELQRRTGLRDALQLRISDAARRRDADLELRSAITAWESDLPPDGLGGLRTRTTAAKAALDDAMTKEKRATEALAQLRSAFTGCEARISDVRERLARLDSTLPRVRSAAEYESDYVEPGRTRSAAIPREIDRVRVQRDRAHEDQRQAIADVQSIGTESQLEKRRRNELRAELAALPEPTGPTDLSVAAARAAVEIAETNLRERFEETTLRQAVRQAEKEVAKAAQLWNAIEDGIRGRAAELATSATGSDPATRAEAAERAGVMLTRAAETHGTERGRLRDAQTRYETAQSARPKGAVEIENPTDREHALDLADRSTDEMAQRETTRHRLDGDRDAALKDATAAKARQEMLNDQIALLRSIEPTDTSTFAIPVDNAGVRSVVQRIVDELAAAEAALGKADRVRAEQADLLDHWAGSDEFVTLAEDEHGSAVRRLREMFRDKNRIERVADNADELVHDLDVRAKAIAQQLEQVETHKRNVVVRMIELVDDGLSMLTRASTLSELPEGIGPWAHKRFLAVEPRSRPSREQIGLRVGELVEAMVASGRIETDAAELLWRATEVSVPEGFRATVLKPAPDQPTGRTPVEEMRKWSGGENLTASLVLFCVLARLRAERRVGSRTGAAGGVLPLDNPLGKANYLPFLDLQRRVAQACGVQLVFWTGIGDLGAVTTFPRIAAMHKRPSTTRAGRAYVQVDMENSQLLDIVSMVRRES